MSVDSYHVSQAVIQELPEISVLFNAYRIFYGQASNVEAALEFLLDRFEHQESVILIARNGRTGQMAGFTQLYPSFSSISMERTWILNDLYVMGDSRKQGVGRMLLLAAKEYAEQTGSKGLSLSTAVDNLDAQRLYESMGYERDTGFVHYVLHILKQSGLSG